MWLLVRKILYIWMQGLQKATDFRWLHPKPISSEYYLFSSFLPALQSWKSETEVLIRSWICCLQMNRPSAKWRDLALAKGKTLFTKIVFLFNAKGNQMVIKGWERTEVMQTGLPRFLAALNVPRNIKYNLRLQREKVLLSWKFVFSNA